MKLKHQVAWFATAVVLLGVTSVTAAERETSRSGPTGPLPTCAEDPCEIAIGEALYCAEPDYFCEDPTDDVLDSVPTPHEWTAADIDIFIASVVDGDLDGDISAAALDELRILLEAGGSIDDITAWFVVYFDSGNGFLEGDPDPGDRISTALCKQACRRLPGILPSQCKKVCKRVRNATRVGFRGLCEHMDRHRESGRALCWQIYNALWPSDDKFETPNPEPEAVFGFDR